MLFFIKIWLKTIFFNIFLAFLWIKQAFFCFFNYLHLLFLEIKNHLGKIHCFTVYIDEGEAMLRIIVLVKFLIYLTKRRGNERDSSIG